MNIHFYIQRIFLLIHLQIEPSFTQSKIAPLQKHHWKATLAQIPGSMTIRTGFWAISVPNRSGFFDQSKKSFYDKRIHLFELTYVRRVKMSYSIMICVYDEYWYVSPNVDKASRNILTSFFVQSRPHSISKGRGFTLTCIGPFNGRNCK